MDIVTAALSILLVIILFLIMRPDPEKSRIMEMLSKIPGPPAYPVLGNAWELINLPLHRYIDVSSKHNKDYGPIFCTWIGTKGEVNLNTAETAEVILSSSDHIDKSETYSELSPWLGDSLFLKQGQKWHASRKLSSPAFSSIIIDSYLEVFTNNSEILVQKLMAKIDGGEFDVCPYLARFTLDAICETVAGIKLNVQNNKNMSYINALHDIVNIVQVKHSTPWFLWNFLFRYFRIRKRYEECIAIVHQFSENIVRDRLSEDGGTENNNDLLLCELYDSEVRRKNMDTLGLALKKLRKEDLQEAVDGLVFAGHDTIYSALSWAIQLLGEHNDIQEKVYEEMVRIFEGSDRSPMKQDLLKMKYLERVIKETLRLYPSGSSVGRKSRRDIQMGEYTIPAGVTIWVKIYHIHHNPKYYPNPEEFNPDNFLPERVHDRHPYAYLPFSAGPRNCLGQRYAIMEMKTVLSSIVRNFKIRSLNKTKDIHPVMGLTLTPHGGVHIELTLRENDKEK